MNNEIYTGKLYDYRDQTACDALSLLLSRETFGVDELPAEALKFYSDVKRTTRELWGEKQPVVIDRTSRVFKRASDMLMNAFGYASMRFFDEPTENGYYECRQLNRAMEALRMADVRMLGKIVQGAMALVIQQDGRVAKSTHHGDKVLDEATSENIQYQLEHGWTPKYSPRSRSGIPIIYKQK